MSHLTILKKNEVYLQIESDPHVFYELSDQFTFELPEKSLCHSIGRDTGMER